jgi:branched-chain amino acid aminotransferase
MQEICYFNGKSVPIDDVTISPRDLGFLRGYAVYDVMPVVNGEPFLFEDHWKRFVRSASDLGLRAPVEEEAAREIARDLVRHHGYETMIVRTVLSGGPSGNGFLPEGNETFCMMVEETALLPRELYDKGGKVITLGYRRTLPSSRTADFIVPLKERERKLAEGAVEILYVHGGRVLEASTSNFFIVKDGEIRTTGHGPRSGITRNLIVRLAKGAGIPIREHGLFEDELRSCDEAFLTASNKLIVPIVQVNDFSIGKGEVGPVTRRLLSIFDGFIKSYGPDSDRDLPGESPLV